MLLTGELTKLGIVFNSEKEHLKFFLVIIIIIIIIVLFIIIIIII